MLNKDVIRAGWNAERQSIINHLIERKFNPKYVQKVASNFIDSMVFAGLPCTSEAAQRAMLREIEFETSPSDTKG